MRSAAALAAVALALALPAPAQTLKGFEAQFEKAPDAARKAAEAVLEASARLYQAGLERGDPLLTDFGGKLLYAPLLPFQRSLSLPPKPKGEHRLTTASHHVEDRVRGWGGEYRYSAANNLAFEAYWTAYLEEGATYDLHVVGARAVGDLLDEGAASLEYGLGVGGLAGSRHRGGLDVVLGGELRPARAVFGYARAGALFLEGGTLGDLRAGLGARVLGFDLRAGWRTLTGPVRALSGPEVGLSRRL